MNDPQPPQPTPSPPLEPPAGWPLSARNAVIAAGFIVLVVGALADIAHFLDDRDHSVAPTTVLLQPDEADPPTNPITTEADPTPASLPSASPTPIPGLFDPVFNTHTVEPGDVLYDIASRYGTTTQVLIELNSLSDPNRIEVGQVLALPDDASQS